MLVLSHTKALEVRAVQFLADSLGNIRIEDLSERDPELLTHRIVDIDGSGALMVPLPSCAETPSPLSLIPALLLAILERRSYVLMRGNNDLAVLLVIGLTNLSAHQIGSSAQMIEPIQVAEVNADERPSAITEPGGMTMEPAKSEFSAVTLAAPAAVAQ